MRQITSKKDIKGNRKEQDNSCKTEGRRTDYKQFENQEHDQRK